MKVIVDRLNGTLSILMRAGPTVRSVRVDPQAVVEFDAVGRPRGVVLFRPFDRRIRRHLLPRLAAQLHVPHLAHLDPASLLESGEGPKGSSGVPGRDRSRAI